MSVFVMSKAQLEAYEAGRIERLQVGVFGCPSGEVVCAEGVCDDECGCCEESSLWEAALDGLEPECPTCRRPALLVEVRPQS